MFYVYGIFSTNGMEIKEIETYWHSGTFTCIFDRRAKISATDARRYVGWGRGGRHALRFHDITLIQEILATT
jgi:hypothetical protein